MKPRRSQVAVIVLWVLVILTMLAVSIGHRLSLGLRLNRYQRDGLKAHYLAKAGITKAIAVLSVDDATVDSFNDTWSTGEDAYHTKLLENITLSEGSGETFTVQYLYDKEKKTYLCMEDEERKININSMDKEQLKELFKLWDPSLFPEDKDAEALANTLIDWIDEDVTTQGGITESLLCKNAAFKTPEEVCLAFEYFFLDVKKNPDDYPLRARELYDKIKDIITVFGSGKVNINTASRDVLTILATAAASKYKLDPTEVGNLVGVIVDARESQEHGPFQNPEAIDAFASTITVPNRNIIYEKMKSYLVPSSAFFRIQSQGQVHQVTKSITAVYDRTNQTIVYWHQH